MSKAGRYASASPSTSAPGLPADSSAPQETDPPRLPTPNCHCPADWQRPEAEELTETSPTVISIQSGGPVYLLEISANSDIVIL